ncbi:hypothetical protein LEN26_014357 [Aphanomyces euteiches]|nr:hypothetical protein LEN26_014357 [Aphanomyces euteiches]KAH9115185.1 hypothetical protein AeMF1_010768 [Aphanomyces euteiches]KAH9191635.1 hypothetical protein AeNC1_006397 [Aphanomyces euteiches]
MVSRSPSNAATEANPLLEEALQHKFDQAKLEQDNVAHDSPNATEESFELVKLALPIIATLILEFLPGAFAVAVVGHIDSPLKKEYVDAATLSVMFLNITGLSIGFGLSTAMDTLCSQTVGAGKLYNLGMYFQSGLIVLGSMFIPAWIVNYNTEFFLLALGQDPTVAALAGSFSKISVFAMPGVFLYELIKKVLQAQKIVSPMAYIAVLTNLVYFGLGYYLCYETDIGFLGAAYARAISQSLLPIFAYLYLLWNPVHKDWWPTDHGMLMMILEWWAFELCEVIAGWMPNPVLSISVQSVLMSLASQAFSIYLGINIATTVRLGNALGVNEPNRAHMISNVALGISLAAGVFMSIVFLITRDFLPRAFISDPTSIA